MAPRTPVSAGQAGESRPLGRSPWARLGGRAAAWRLASRQDDAAHDLVCRQPQAVGEPDEGQPHGRVEVAGGGNQDRGPRRPSLTLPADGGRAERQCTQISQQRGRRCRAFALDVG